MEGAVKDDHKTNKGFGHEVEDLQSQNIDLKKSIADNISAELAADKTHRYA
jgi:hypothetical protein